MEKHEQLALAIDFGTQSVRAIIFSQKGEILAKSQYHYKPAYYSNKPGYCEQDINYYWNHMCEVTQELAAVNPKLMKRVAAISYTTFRDTAVCLDENHKPLRDVILWCDQRVASCNWKSFPFYKFLLFKSIGMWETVVLNRKRSMSNWIIENQPEIWAKTKYYWSISTYFGYKLTGEEKDTAANYTGHYPIDMKTGKYFTKSSLKYDIFNIEIEKLPKLVKCGTVLGHITEECAVATGLPAGIPVIANGTDKGSETVGTGCITPNMASISYGTASTIEVSNRKYIEPQAFLPSYNACIDKLYNMEVQIYRGYWMITWFKDNFGEHDVAEAIASEKAVEEVLNEKMLEIPPGSDGLVLQPYWGPDLKRPLAKGTIVGFADYHTKYHLYKAIIEGIGFALREALEEIEKHQKQMVEEIYVSGGGSRSDAVCQITSDIFGIPVHRIQTTETASLGCAMVAYTGIGVFDKIEDAIEAMRGDGDIFYPDKENFEKYNFLFWNTYVSIYPSLTKVNKSLTKFHRKYVRNEVL